MMDTATNSANEAIAIDTSFNTGYLKTSSKDYLPTGTPTNANAFSRPRVIQWDPHMGTEQSTITVVLEQAVSDGTSNTPTLNDQIQPMKLVFGRLVVETNQQQQRAPTASPSSTLNSQLVWITLVARAPRFEETQIGHGNQVPLSVCVYDSRHSDTATDHWDFGVFTYNNKSGVAASNVGKDSSAEAAAGEGSTDTLQGRKRGVPSSDQDFGNSNKRPHTSLQQEDDDQLFNQLLAPFDDSPGKASSVDTSTISSLQHSTQQQHYHHPHRRPSQAIAPQPSLSYSASNTSNAFIQPNPYSNSGNTSLNDYHHPVNIQPSPMHHQHQINYNTYQNNTFANYPSQHQHPQGYNVSSSSSSVSAMYPNYSQQAMFSSQPIQASQQQPHGMMMPSMSSKSITDASGISVPTTVTNSATTATAPASADHPFAGVLSKANLKIMGDIMEMTWQWSPEEWANGRRLVKFWRKQHAAGESSQQKDNQVECGFEAIEQETYQQQRIRENLAAQKDGTQKKSSPLVVSCIYWRERNDYYITSVDCIYLLEGLIGVQFTVEEKNRIRRNLEGFRPLTVSKCKPECADFFKLIMSFPHPKPRNIEKDVKVFSWKSLPSALTKIIRKYTPSYSSTVVANIN